MTRREKTVNTEDTLLYSVDTVARMFAMSSATVRRRIASGDIPHVRVGRSIRIPAGFVRRVSSGDVVLAADPGAEG